MIDEVVLVTRHQQWDNNIRPRIQVSFVATSWGIPTQALLGPRPQGTLPGSVCGTLVGKPR